MYVFLICKYKVLTLLTKQPTAVECYSTKYLKPYLFIFKPLFFLFAKVYCIKTDIVSSIYQTK